LTRVEDIKSDTLVIGAPVEDGYVVSLFPNTEVIVKVFLPEGVRRYSGRVKQMYSGRLPVVEVERFSDLGIVQRRKYPRAHIRMPVSFRVEKRGGGEGRWCEGTTVDMSMGGLQIEDTNMTSHVSAGDFVEVKLTLAGKTDVQAICHVVRVQNSGASRFALEFAEIDAGAQEKLARHIERNWLESDSDRRHYVRSKVPIEIRYKCAKQPMRKTSSNDVSTGGLRMMVEGKGFAVGEDISLIIELPQKKKLKADGIIVWVGDSWKAEADHWEIGVKFTKMDAQSRDTLAKFLLTVQRGDEAKAA